MMAIREITLMGNPVLSGKAKQVGKESLNSTELASIIEDMRDTLASKGGVGLAAPQIGESLQIFVINILPDRAEREACDSLSYQFFINPEFISMSEEKIEDAEASFSMPGLMGAVNRSNIVEVKALDLNGQEFTLKAQGFLARVLQHEMDHLDGILYWLRISECSKFGFLNALPGACDPRQVKPTLSK